MTLISVIYGNGYPVIVSDRAISSPGSADKIILPTTGRLTDDDTPVVEFRVKSVIIKDILCAAFSGLVIEIERVRQELIDFFLHRDVNRNTLDEFLHLVKYDDEDISVVYALGGPEFEDNKIQIAISGIWRRDHSKVKLDILAAGKGAAEWIYHFHDYYGYVKSSGDKATDCRNRALLAVTNFVSEEWQSSTNLRDGWGGGFDIVYYQDGKFQRMDEVAYAFYLVSEEDGTIKELLINHNKYDDLCVVATNITFASDPQFNIISQFGETSTIDTKSLNWQFKSDDVVTCMFIKRKDGRLDITITLLKDFDPNATPIFLAAKIESGFQFTFKPIYYEKLQEVLSEFLS